MPMVAVAASRPDFKLKDLTTNEALYSASMSEFQRHHWDNAVSGFEKLTTDLPARDTLLPRSYWYLATAHERQGEHLLAAQSYSRLVESFPDDSLADDAALEAARAYRRMWRKPQLDPTYGETALASYNTLLGLYPTSPLIPAAQKDIADLENWFAAKDFDAGMYYFRRKLYISASVFFKDALTKYPAAPTVARMRRCGWSRRTRRTGIATTRRSSARSSRMRYPTDKSVRDVCTGVAPPAVVKPDTLPPPAVKPPPPPT